MGSRLPSVSLQHPKGTALTADDEVVTNNEHFKPLCFGRYLFKMADQEEEFHQIHILNCQTFVHEINRHPDPGSEALIDRFHHKNTYFIGKRGERVVGMICLHDEPPYSVAEKLDDPSLLDELEHPLLEARLLSVVPNERYQRVSAGLFWCLYHFAGQNGYRHIVISGLSNRLKMYQRLGFRPLGPPVLSGQAEFIPMVVDFTDLPKKILHTNEQLNRRLEQEDTSRLKRLIILQPGPVEIHEDVGKAFRAPSISHRSTEFVDRYQAVRQVLCDMTGADEAVLIVGSSTVANDVVAASLQATPTLQRGLILVNGEFGWRLVTQARRFDLQFETMQWSWGQPWNHDAIASRLRQSPEIHWIWATHLETSTGMVNDIDHLRTLTGERRVRICLDCVSSLGALELNLQGIHLASGTSGKSLGSYAGVAIVFASREAIQAAERHDGLPEYLDLVAAARTRGPRYTIASPLFGALESALEPYAHSERRQHRYDAIASVGRFVRHNLRTLETDILVDGDQAAPTVTTFSPPTGIDTETFCRLCEESGYILGGLSGYLKARGWLQLATMGDVEVKKVQPLFERLGQRMKALRKKEGAR